MKKLFALLCGLLLLSVSAAAAEGSPVVNYNDRIQLNGLLPDGYRFSLESQTDLALEGRISSDDPAAPVLDVYIAFNESYAGIATLKDLGEEMLDLIRQGFSSEDEVSFSSFETASSDSLLVIRENGGRFLDFYTVCSGYEIELTLFPADKQLLTEEQISRCLELMRTLDIIPL